MGEMADLIASGQQCSHCGVMFEAEHGFPVVCKDCKKAGTALPVATEEEL